MDPSGDVLFDENEDDNTSSSTADEGLMTLFQRGGSSDKETVIPLAPPSGLEWDNEAVMDCFALSVNSHGKEQAAFVDWIPTIPLAPHRSHHQTHPGTTGKKEADLTPLNDWQPEVLTLPRWAMKEHDGSHDQQLKDGDDKAIPCTAAATIRHDVSKG